MLRLNCKFINKTSLQQLRNKNKKLGWVDEWVTELLLQVLFLQSSNTKFHEPSHKQTWANNSTRYRYSKIIQKSGNIWGQIPGQIIGNDSTGVIFINIKLRLDLGHIVLIFTLITNLESGP